MLLMLQPCKSTALLRVNIVQKYSFTAIVGIKTVT